MKKTINPLIILIVFISLNVPCYGGDRDSFAPWEFNNSGPEEKVEIFSSSPGYLLQGIELLWSYISSVDGDRCPMHPTCSAYSLQAFKKHGFFIGFMMTADRLIHEGSEMDYAPLVKVGDRYKFYDPVSNNDFWWYEVGDRRSEVGGQRPEVRGQKSEVRSQRPEVRGQRGVKERGLED